MSVRSAAKAPFGTGPLLAFPSFDVVERKGVVGILGEVRGVVEHHQRQDHVFEWNFVHRDAVLGEMRRRIDVRAVLPDHLVVGGAEAVFGDRVRLMRLRIGGRGEFRLAETGPHRRIGTETMREIDERLRSDRLIGALDVRLRLRERG